MRKRVKIRGNLFQFVELRKKLLFGQFGNGKTALGFVMCVMKYFIGLNPCLLVQAGSS